MQVSIIEARSRLPQLIRSVQAGEEVVIANRGEPVARLVPMEPTRACAAEVGSAAAVLGWLSSHPLASSSRRSAGDIDADIEAERAAWAPVAAAV